MLDILETLRLTNVINFHQDWNEELILQFYATLFISGDPKDSTTWEMEWMTQDHRCKASAYQFMSHYHFHRFELNGKEMRLHMQDTVKSEVMHMLR